MFKSLRKALRRNGNKEENTGHRQNSHQRSMSPNSTISSTTTTSNLPLTPSGPVMHDTRGIFRTLEPVWYYCNTDGHWDTFGQHAQLVIEKAYSRNKSTVTLEEPIMMLHFNNNNNNNNTADDTYKWVIDKTVRRSVMPVWWYEQNSFMDGSKGMCRFDYKNQIRLETLSSDDECRTQLTLTDEAFPESFTISLDYSEGRDLKETWRGLLHLEIPVVQQYYFYDDTKENNYSEMSPLEDGITLSRRFSI